MLIQCQSCTSKYRLKLERQPARKMFVRCKNCGTPIYIHAEAVEEEPAPEPPPPVTIPEALAESPVIPPVLIPPEEAPDPLLVACPQCGARYHVPPHPMQRPGVKFKCTQCEAVFPPPPAPRTPSAFQPRPPQSPRTVPPESAMPVPNESRLSILFDDLRPGEERTLAKDPAEGAPPPAEAALANTPAKPDDAYLEAISLGDAPPSGGFVPVPETQKYRYFLKPEQLNPDHKDLPAGDLPPDGAPESPAGPPSSAAAARKEPMTQIDDKDLPPLENVKPPGPSKGAAPPAPPPPSGGAPAARSVEKPPVPDQTGWLSTQSRYILIATLGAVVLVLSGLWSMWLIQAPDAGQYFAIEIGMAHQISLGSTLDSRYVANTPTGKRLFVVQGEVENRFGAGREISWIRLRGTAYADEQQSRVAGAAFAFVGNVLTEQQLSSLDPKAIFAHAAYVNGQGNANFRIPSGGKVPFQLVFTDTSAPVARTVTQVVSYHRDRIAVYVDPGR